MFRESWIENPNFDKFHDIFLAHFNKGYSLKRKIIKLKSFDKPHITVKIILLHHLDIE